MSGLKFSHFFCELLNWNCVVNNFIEFITSESSTQQIVWQIFHYKYSDNVHIKVLHGERFRKQETNFHLNVIEIRCKPTSLFTPWIWSLRTIEWWRFWTMALSRSWYIVNTLVLVSVRKCSYNIMLWQKPQNSQQLRWKLRTASFQMYFSLK